jgi:hypothetical protein
MSQVCKRIASVIILLVLPFAGSGCKPEKEGVPDPARPPTPKVVVSINSDPARITENAMERRST